MIKKNPILLVECMTEDIFTETNQVLPLVPSDVLLNLTICKFGASLGKINIFLFLYMCPTGLIL